MFNFDNKIYVKTNTSIKKSSTILCTFYQLTKNPKLLSTCDFSKYLRHKSVFFFAEQTSLCIALVGRPIIELQFYTLTNYNITHCISHS